MDSRRRRRRAPGGNQDWISLSGMSFPCVVGLNAAERERLQPVDVEVALRVDLEAASAGDLGASVDYGTFVSEIELIVVETRFRLLESLAAALARHLLAPGAPSERRAEVQAVRVKVAKPEIFAGQAVPHVEIQRDRGWLRSRSRERAREHGQGHLDCLQATDERAAYHLTLGPGAGWTLPTAGAAQVLCGAIESNQQRFTRGARLAGGGRIRADPTLGARLLLVGAVH